MPPPQITRPEGFQAADVKRIIGYSAFVWRIAADMDLTVPGDVSIIGLDDIELASHTIPRLTTVLQKKNALGQLAFERLHSRILNPALPPERKILPTCLVIRESCGPAPTKAD
jgi:LacI family transcriptional regulator